MIPFIFEALYISQSVSSLVVFLNFLLLSEECHFMTMATVGVTEGEPEKSSDDSQKREAEIVCKVHGDVSLQGDRDASFFLSSLESPFCDRVSHKKGTFIFAIKEEAIKRVFLWSPPSRETFP